MIKINSLYLHGNVCALYQGEVEELALCIIEANINSYLARGKFLGHKKEGSLSFGSNSEKVIGAKFRSKLVQK